MGTRRKDPPYGEMVGATSTEPGRAGTVPAPEAGDETKFLRADGSWAENSASGGASYDVVADFTERLALTGLSTGALVLQEDVDHIYMLVDAENPNLGQSWIDLGPRYYLLYDGGTFDQGGWSTSDGSLQFAGHSVYATRDITTLGVESSVDGTFHLDQFADTLTSLTISGNGETPTVSVAALVNLTELALVNLGLTTVDSESLPLLQSLNLSNNALTSYDPSAHTALITLILSSNALANVIDISVLTALSAINLSNNAFSTSTLNAVAADLVVIGSNNTGNLSGQTPIAPLTGVGITDALTLRTQFLEGFVADFLIYSGGSVNQTTGWGFDGSAGEPIYDGHNVYCRGFAVGMSSIGNTIDGDFDFSSLVDTCTQVVLIGPSAEPNTIDVSGLTHLVYIAMQSISLTSPPDTSGMPDLAGLEFNGNGAGLVTFDITANPLLTLLRANNNGFTTTVVNATLAAFVAGGLPNGTCIIHLQTPSAPPSGQGIIDSGTLTGAGWTVITD